MTQEAFRIVHKAMRKMKKVGIGQITMHNREYLVALKAYQKGFLLKGRQLVELDTTCRKTL